MCSLIKIVLEHVGFDRLTLVTTDASGVIFGANLSQINRDLYRTYCEIAWRTIFLRNVPNLLRNVKRSHQIKFAMISITISTAVTQH